MKISKLVFLASFVLAMNTSIAGDQEKFVGTWTLEALEIRNDSGNWEEFTERVPDTFAGRIGPKPLGLIIYDAAGNMAVQIMRRDRAEFESDDVVNIDADKIKPAYTGYSAYFGTYEVVESEGIVFHRRIANLIPNYVGSEVKRAYQLEGDRLMLSAAPDRRLVWRKIN